jgi:hypothetical protein
MKHLHTFESFLNEGLTDSQTKMIKDYLALKKAVNNPGYKDTAHTRAELAKSAENLKTMLKSNSIKRDALALLSASDVEEILQSN